MSCLTGVIWDHVGKCQAFRLLDWTQHDIMIRPHGEDIVSTCDLSLLSTAETASSWRAVASIPACRGILLHVPPKVMGLREEVRLVEGLEDESMAGMNRSSAFPHGHQLLSSEDPKAQMRSSSCGRPFPIRSTSRTSRGICFSTTQPFIADRQYLYSVLIAAEDGDSNKMR